MKLVALGDFSTFAHARQKFLRYFKGYSEFVLRFFKALFLFFHNFLRNL